MKSIPGHSAEVTMLRQAVAPIRRREFDRFAEPPAALAADAFVHSRDRWLEAFRTVRGETERRAALLSPEDQVVQSMADASPTKWHRAHTTWFFEQFLLKPHAPAYRAFDERFAYLFNSYYVSAGPRHARPRARPRHPSRRRGGRRLSRSCRCRRGEIDRIDQRSCEHRCHHRDRPQSRTAASGIADHRHPARVRTKSHASGLRSELAMAAIERRPCGREPIDRGNSFDRARQRRIFVSTTSSRRTRCCCSRSVSIAASSATREWLAFMADGGYTTPTLWLSDGWAKVEAENWDAPGYWQCIDGQWHSLTLGGLRPVDPQRPVCHVSYYEADAFARWAGKHLPTEAEWEVAAQQRRARRCFRRRLAMDAQRLFAVSEFPRGRGRARRIQRQVHGQPDGAARLLAGDARWPFARDLPQFFPSAGALAIQRAASRPI